MTQEKNSQPVTSEVLERMGFKNTHAGKDNPHNGFYQKEFVPFEVGYILQDEVYETEINRKVIQLKTVEQLQKLYSALTEG